MFSRHLCEWQRNKQIVFIEIFPASIQSRQKNQCFAYTEKDSKRQANYFFYVPHLRIFTFSPENSSLSVSIFLAIQITNSPCHFYLSSSVLRWKREEDEVPNGHFKSQGSLIAGFLFRKGIALTVTYTEIVRVVIDRKSLIEKKIH